MKTFKTSLKVICLFFIVSSVSILGQWKQCNGPYGGQIHKIAAIGDTIYAGTSGAGLYLSPDKGKNWTNIGLNNHYFSAIAFKDSYIFVGTESGLFLSSDKGANWILLNTGLVKKNINSIEISGNKIFAGTSDEGVILSKDNGATWTKINTGLTNLGIRGLVINGINIFAGTKDGGIFSSKNDGESWNKISSQVNENIYCLTISEGNIYAGTKLGVYTSNDNGSSWFRVGKSISDVCNIAFSSNKIFLQSFNDIYSSTNNGMSWDKVNLEFSLNQFNCIIACGNDLFIGSEGGVLCSTDSGEKWSIVNDGIKNAYVQRMAKNSKSLIAGTYYSGVFLSTNDGIDWKLADKESVGSFVDCVAIKGTNLFYGSSGNGIKYSSNNGANWSIINNGMDMKNNRALSLLISGEKVFAGTSGGLYVSSDNGLNWTRLNNGLKDTVIRSLAINGNNLYAGTDSKGIFLSTNSGESWTEINNGLNQKRIESIKISEENIYALSTFKIFKSTNNGIEWTQYGQSKNQIYDFAISNKNLFAAKFNEGITLSNDNGLSWSEISNGLYNRNGNSLLVDGNTIYFGTLSNSIYMADINAITGIEDLPKTSSTTLLFPNPAQNTLNIRLDKESASATYVRVLDVCGRTVALGQIPAGSKEFALDVKDLPIGMYLLNLVTGNEVMTEKFGVWR